MGLHDAPGDGQAQAGASGLGGVEGLEEVPPLFGRQAGAVIPHGDADGGLPVAVDLGPLDVDLHGVVTRGQGVVQEIAEDLLEVEVIPLANRVRQAPLGEPGLSALARRFQAGPGLVQDVAEGAPPALEEDGAA